MAADRLPRLHRRGPIEARDSARESARRCCVFHGFIDVAPLKPDRHGMIWRRLSTVFHGFIAVAPLKRSGPARDWASTRRLPRLHRRGPIEAGRASDTAALHVYVFHGFIAVAPLKQHASGAAMPVTDVFHGFIAVAPLKHVLTTCGSPGSRRLPRLHRRGPIEASHVLPPESHGSSSTASSPWPH